VCSSDLFYFDLALPWWAGAVAVGLIAWILNLRGAAVASRAQLLIIAVSVIPFLLTAAAAILHAGPNNTLAVFSWNNPHGGDLFGALLFCILLFGGFDLVGQLVFRSGREVLHVVRQIVGRWQSLPADRRLTAGEERT
jgi:amino acid transporter